MPLIDQIGGVRLDRTGGLTAGGCRASVTLGLHCARPSPMDESVVSEIATFPSGLPDPGAQTEPTARPGSDPRGTLGLTLQPRSLEPAEPCRCIRARQNTARKEEAGSSDPSPPSPAHRPGPLPGDADRPATDLQNAGRCRPKNPSVAGSRQTRGASTPHRHRIGQTGHRRTPETRRVPRREESHSPVPLRQRYPARLLSGDPWPLRSLR